MQRVATAEAGRGFRGMLARLVLATLSLLLPLGAEAAADVVLAPFDRPYDVQRAEYRIEVNVRRTDATRAFLAAADPGQEIEFACSVYSNSLNGVLSKPVSGTVTAVSISGAGLAPGRSLWYPDGRTPEHYDVLPYTYRNENPTSVYPGVVGGFLGLVAKVGNLDKKGRSKPVRLTVSINMEWVDTFTGDPTLSVDETVTVEVPVTDAPPLEVSARLFSNHAGELSPGGLGTLQYTVRSPNATMEPLTLRVKLPKGTTVAPGTVFPANGVATGGYVTWNVAGPVPQFVAQVGVRVKARPGTKRTATVYRASARILGFPRKATDQLTIPIRTLDVGTIEYYAGSGTGGPVRVGSEYLFACSGWDPDGGDIFVSLNDVGVTTVPYDAPVSTFRVPPFRDPDLEHVLSARQTAKPSDTVVTGEVAGECERILGNVFVRGDDGTTYRRLGTGSLLAAGEFDRGGTPLGTSNRFGFVQVDGTASLALIRLDDQASGTRLLYARGGEVAVYGQILLGGLRHGTGKGATSVSFPGAGDLTVYDTKDRPDVTTYFDVTQPSSGQVGSSGFSYARNWKSLAGLRIEGGLFYIEGSAEIRGDVTGTGTLVVNGSLTHRGRFQLESQGGLALAVAGTFETAP